MADIVIILWIVLCLYGVNYCKGKNNYWEDYLSKENTLMLKGVFSIVVILHHLSQRFTPLTTLYKYFNYAGPWAVMMFFFISGYGVMYNWINKKNYDKGFLIKRFKAIIPLYLIAIIIYWIVNEILNHHYSIFGVVHSMIDGSPIVLHSWYILVILAFYVLFCLQMKVFKKNYLLIIISSVILCCGCVLLRRYLNYGGWWSDYIFSIPLGMAWALYKERIDNIIQRHYWIFLLFSFLMFIVSWRCSFENAILYYLFNYGGKLYRQSMFFPITVMLICMKLKIGNKALEHLGKISLETYIFHGLFSSLVFTDLGLQNSIGGGLLYSIVSITCAIVFASIVNLLYTKVKKVK